MKTLVLAGDDIVLLHVLEGLLRRAGYQVLGEGLPLSDGHAAVEGTRPDVAVAAILNVTPAALASARLIVQAQDPRPSIIVASRQALADGRLMHLKASIYVAREHDPVPVLDAIDAAVACTISPLDGAGAGGVHADPGLTGREEEVLELLRAGRSTKAIAIQLRLSGRTVDFHRANIKHKLGLHSGAELIAFASRRR